MGDTSTTLKPKVTRAQIPPAFRITDHLRIFVAVARKQRRGAVNATGKTPTTLRKAWPAVKQWRRVIGKVSKSMQNVAWKGHAYYIQRERANEDRACFDRDLDTGVNASERLAEWQNAGDPHITKITLSPEYSDGFDPKEFTRRFVRELEADHKTTFEWLAAVHTNTDHIHVHLVIRGIAANGRVVDLSHDYVRDRVSMYACAVATELAGMDTRQHERGREREQIRNKSRDA